MASILFDVKTLEVFSEQYGWNEREASIRKPNEWLKIIYHFRFANDESWRGRELLNVPLPQEQEEFT